MVISSRKSQTVLEKKKPDFLDAIQTKRPMHITVQSGSENCVCEECQDPILEWEEEHREPKDDDSDREGYEGYSSTASVDQQDLDEESSFEEGTGPATPLPTNLDDAFGRLTCEDSSPIVVQHHDEQDSAPFERCDVKGKGKPVGSDVSDEQVDVSYSSGASGYNVDNFPDHLGVSKATILAKESQAGFFEGVVIDLVESDEDEDDEDFLLRNTKNCRRSSSSQILVDSSEDETHGRSIPTRKRPIRQRVPTTTLNIESDSDDDSCHVLSDFDDESSSDAGDLRVASRRSFSKLAKTPTRLDLETENWNPNRTKLKTAVAPASFKKNKEALSKEFFDEYNNAVFEGQLATQVNIVWSNKLRTTAGLTRLKRRQVDFTPGAGLKRSATIELSTKVLDDPERLASTLLHEMVHAAAWILGKSVFW